MANKILVFIEQRNNLIKKSSLETVSAAIDLAGKTGAAAEGVIIGGSIQNLDSVSKSGLSKIVHLNNDELSNYSSSAYSGLFSDYAKESEADIILFANTAMGKDLAPLITVKLGGAIAMDCVKLDYNEGNIIAARPVYAGKALVDVKIKSDIQLFTVRSNVYKPAGDTGNETEIEVRDIREFNHSSKVTEFVKAGDKLDVAEADIIVSGGRGMKGPENYKILEDLAAELGGAVGASRAAVDAGWRPHSDQVGQTGKTVSPNLYIACGISGAIQHLAGMRSSKYIVAINKDPDAPIYTVADYGIAGDLFEIVPVLLEEIKKVKAG